MQEEGDNDDNEDNEGHFTVNRKTRRVLVEIRGRKMVGLLVTNEERRRQYSLLLKDKTLSKLKK